MAKLSYKVSYYALYVMFAIILVVLGMFFFGGDAQGDAVLASVDAEMWQPAHTDALIYLMFLPRQVLPIQDHLRITGCMKGYVQI